MEGRNNKPPMLTSFQELLSACRDAFNGDTVDVDYVMEMLASYTSKYEEWKRFAKFDRHRYTRNLVDEGNGKYNIMLLCWGEGMESSIHAHANSHCFMKNLMGELLERRFDFPKAEGAKMEPKEMHPLKLNQVAYINDELGLHRVENPSHTDVAVSLHIYIPPFQECKIFDPSTGRENISKMTFWSRYGKRTPFQVFDKATWKTAAALNAIEAMKPLESAEKEDCEEDIESTSCQVAKCNITPKEDSSQSELIKTGGSINQQVTVN